MVAVSTGKTPLLDMIQGEAIQGTKRKSRVSNRKLIPTIYTQKKTLNVRPLSKHDNELH